MAGKFLPIFTLAEVESQNTTNACYVTMGSKVYDLSSFAGNHPGGGSLILEYAGKDVTEILSDPASHNHSTAAYEILEEHLVGILKPDSSAKSPNTDEVLTYGTLPVYSRARMSYEEDLAVEPNFKEDLQTRRFLDLNKPLLMQLWTSGFSKQFYLEQVHRPRHYTKGDSAPLFGNFLEPLSKTAWYVVPIIWAPPAIYGTYIGVAGLGNSAAATGYCLLGFFLWSLIEYVMHRFLFHIERFLPDNRVAISLHFLLHGFHHYLPMDKYRLVMPPVVFVILASPFWKLAREVFYYNWYVALIVYCGGIFGYIHYDLTHYFLHHCDLPLYHKQLKTYHLLHHFADYNTGFGVTSRFWDWVFGSQVETPRSPLCKGPKAL